MRRYNRGNKYLELPAQNLTLLRAFNKSRQVKQQIFVPVKFGTVFINHVFIVLLQLLTSAILGVELPRTAVLLLTTIYNSMPRLTYFPLLWKFAQIIMIHKPGKPPVTSYRPISLLPIMSKIFEKNPSQKNPNGRQYKHKNPT
jgi:hypothetical protein